MDIDRERLEPVLREHGVAVAYLFGSQAKGTARPDSDVDIAVLFSEPPRSYDPQIRLSYALGDLLGIEVDVIDLDRVRLELRACAASPDCATSSSTCTPRSMMTGSTSISQGDSTTLTGSRRRSWPC